MELMDIFSSVQDLATLYYYALFLGLAITRKQYLWLLGAILTAHGMSMLYFAVLGQSHNPFSFTWIPQFYLLVNGLLFYTHRIDWLNKDGIVAGDSFNAAIKKSWAARARKEKPLAAFAISMILQHLAFLAIYLLVWLLDLPHALGDRAEFARASHEAFFLHRLHHVPDVLGDWPRHGHGDHLDAVSRRPQAGSRAAPRRRGDGVRDIHGRVRGDLRVSAHVAT